MGLGWRGRTDSGAAQPTARDAGSGAVSEALDAEHLRRRAVLAQHELAPAPSLERLELLSVLLRGARRRCARLLLQVTRTRSTARWRQDL
jgi:hypothetical protein